MKNKKSYIICLLAIAVIIFIVTAGLTSCRQVKYDDSYKLEMREGCSDFYYSHLSKNQQKMYRMLYKEAESILYGGEEKDTLGTYNLLDYGLSHSEAVTVWYAFRYDAPAFFIISNSFKYSPGYITVKIAPEFADKGMREKALKAIENSVEEVRGLLEGIEGSAMKFQIIYDYVMEHTEYDADDKGNIRYNGYSCSIAGVLDGDSDTKSICQGYAGTLSYLCNMFGVECVYVGCERKHHALNIVNIDDKWYYADATLDDTDEEYKYFLLGDDYEWQLYIKQKDNESQNYLRSVLPKLERYKFGNSLSDRTRNGDFYCSINGKRGVYFCTIVGCAEGVENLVVPTNFGLFEVSGCQIYDNINLKSVKLSDGLTSSGYYSNCVNLTNVDLPQSVTVISFHAFQGCSSLTSIELPQSVTVIDYGAFQGCSSLTSIDLPNSVTNIEDYAFYKCSSLKSIKIPQGINIYSYAFKGCSKLKNIEIIERAGYSGGISASAFEDCDNLTVTVSAGVSLSGAFKTIVEKLVINGGESIPYGAFSDFTSLTSIEIPSSVTSIGDRAFEGCSSLASIVIPNSVTSMGYKVFWDCSNLTIYCEAESQPSGWDSGWNIKQEIVIPISSGAAIVEYEYCPVVWGYKAS